jgi:hypothetical protein
MTNEAGAKLLDQAPNQRSHSLNVCPWLPSISITSICCDAGPRGRGAVEERRQQLLVAAGLAAEALRERWPVLQGVWLFGSSLKAGCFRRHSDLDLVVEGLPAVPLARTPAAAGPGPHLKPWQPLLPSNCVIWPWI